MKKNILVSMVVLILFIAGALYLTIRAPWNEKSDPLTALYTDGSITVAVTFDNDEETVTFTYNSLGTVTLPRAVSASGARFANLDESIVFWEHQGEARISQGGKVVFEGKKLKRAAWFWLLNTTIYVG